MWIPQEETFTSISEKSMNLICEWKNCSMTFSKSDNLHNHMVAHADLLQEERYHNQNGSNSFECGICSTEVYQDRDWLLRHVHFHALQITLRERGRLEMEARGWRPCQLDGEAKTLVPELPTQFECEWEFCDFTTNNVVTFYHHVAKHPEEYLDSRYPSGTPLRCLWEGCGQVLGRLPTLVYHMAVHTQEKAVACPGCGLGVTAVAKLGAHLKRQYVHSVMSEPDKRTFQCLRCRHVFATEQMLREHMRRHINTLKCPHCEATCATKQTLQRHMIFRHSDERNFACPDCTYTCKTADVLVTHSRIHEAGAPPSEGFDCPVDGCSFKSKTVRGLEVHKSRRHPEVVKAEDAAAMNPDLAGLNLSQTGNSSVDVMHRGKRSRKRCASRIYACHLCSVECPTGNHLSKHLTTSHNLTKPPGHARFAYRISEDNRYRLQTTRIDSLEVTTQLLGTCAVEQLLEDQRNETSADLRGDPDLHHQHYSSISLAGRMTLPAASSTNPELGSSLVYNTKAPHENSLSNGIGEASVYSSSTFGQLTSPIEDLSGATSPLFLESPAAGFPIEGSVFPSESELSYAYSP